MENLTKHEAIEAMKSGKKVTHTYFSHNEWMTLVDNVLHFEDGVKLRMELFWGDRTREGWNDGYSIYVEPTAPVMEQKTKEELGREYAKKVNDDGLLEERGTYLSFIKGYESAEQHLFTLQDVEKLMEKAFNSGRERVMPPDYDHVYPTFTDYLNSNPIKK